jgi:hypothetical protein
LPFCVSAHDSTHIGPVDTHTRSIGAGVVVMGFPVDDGLKRMHSVQVGDCPRQAAYRSCQTWFVPHGCMYRKPLAHWTNQ